MNSKKKTFYSIEAQNRRILISETSLHIAVSKRSVTKKCMFCTVKPLLSDHIKQAMFWAFQTGDCLLLNESSAERYCGRTFLRYFHSAISNHLSISMSMPLVDGHLKQVKLHYSNHFYHCFTIFEPITASQYLSQSLLHNI